MRLFRRTALIWVFVSGALVMALAGGQVHASGLSVGMKIRQQLFTPLVPSVKNIRMCFQKDEAGNSVLGVCTKGEEGEQREPAAQESAPAASPGPKRPPGLPAVKPQGSVIRLQE